MTVLGLEVIEKAIRLHADLEGPMRAWLSIAKQARWKHLVELRQTWRDTDFVDGETIFNIKGDSYRLFAMVNYEAQTIIVRQLMTHAEYSKR